MVGSIVHEDLDMRKLSAKWVPKCLNADQERKRCQLSEQLLEFFRRDPNDFLSRFVTMDETWLYHYDPETKQQWMEWRHSGSSRPKKIPSAKIRWKISRLDFLGSRRRPPHWLSSKGPNYQGGVLLISAGAMNILKEKRRGNFAKWVLFLHDNAPAHRAVATHNKLAYLGFQYLDHPSYSPDLAPSDYNLLPGLIKQLKCCNFSSDAEVIAAAETWLDRQPSDFFWVACKS